LNLSREYNKCEYVYIEHLKIIEHRNSHHDLIVKATDQDQGSRYLAFRVYKIFFALERRGEYRCSAFNILGLRGARLEANAGTSSRDRGRESEIREWNERNNPGGEPK
jgi:hypothetical protein